MGSFKKFTDSETGELKLQVRPVSDDRELGNLEQYRTTIEFKTPNDKFGFKKHEIKSLIEYLIRVGLD